jgi:two-component system NtrC family sensor kinase
MKTRSIRTRILTSFFSVITVFTISLAILEYYVIKKDIITKNQDIVRNDLNSAREIYREEVERIRDVIRFTALRFFIKDAVTTGQLDTLQKELESIRKAESLDVLTLTDSTGKVIVRPRNPSVIGDDKAPDDLVSRVLLDHEVIAGNLIVEREELMKEGPDLAEQAHMKLIRTLRAKETLKTEETSGMMIKAAAPVLDRDGELLGVLYGGNLINRHYKIVDKIKEIVFEAVKYRGKEIGTATIFQQDLRISTNVKAKDGSRAIGTRVSQEVYERVLVKGQPWLDRAYVVTDWYKTAYEPIRDINGKIIGILYIGILEQPFVDKARNIFLVFLAMFILAAVLAGLLASALAGDMSRLLKHMLRATHKLSKGGLGHKVDMVTGTTELDVLVSSFNEMSSQLRDREDSLRITNEKLAELNKTYLDLVGFVSHELKGLLGTTIMSAVSVRDGLFGDINAKQKEVLELAAKNLNYLVETVRKFLDLSRIEKGELELKRTALYIGEDVFDHSIETFAGEAAEKKMQVENNIQPDTKVNGDLDLLRIVANNLVGNAIKYGLEGGKVVLSSEDLGDEVQVEVYNDSRPIRDEEKERLFKKFSRLDIPEKKKVKGTGLGLFITREIIVKHGGDIWIEPRENGNAFIFRINKGFPGSDL